MLTRFIRELKRRRVLHTASLYVVGAWIALQAVEVLSEAGLPPGTMRQLLLALSLGLPLVLILGWFFNISTEGIERTGALAPDEALPALHFTDHVLLGGLFLVVFVAAYVLSFSPTALQEPGQQTAARQRTMAVLAFNDLATPEGDEPVGTVIADELRQSLTRTPGLRVMGPETSRLLHEAEKDNYSLAEELEVTTLLRGDVRLDGEQLAIDAKLIAIPEGNEIWSASMVSPISDAIRLQQQIIQAVITVVAPALDSDPSPGPRAEAGECASVYDTYLQARHLLSGSIAKEPFKRGREMMKQVVEKDPGCAIAWEALAVAHVDWTPAGFARAGAAARRALELNPNLPRAWAVLAEIAEQESGWSKAEEYFLKGLYADPTNTHVLQSYSETLMARGRLTDALHYALEAYRFEPAGRTINYRVLSAALGSGKADLAIKHVQIAAELSANFLIMPWMEEAQGYLIKGDTERALEIYRANDEYVPEWFYQCVEARENPTAASGLLPHLEATRDQLESGEITGRAAWYQSWLTIQCGVWLGDADFVYDWVVNDPETPTEIRYLIFFGRYANALRQHSGFREMVVEDGLLDYWREWGWPDFCEPVGDDDFRCD